MEIVQGMETELAMKESPEVKFTIKNTGADPLFVYGLGRAISTGEGAALCDLKDLTAARECIRDLAFQLGVCAELAEHYVPGNGGLTAAKARATLAKHKAEIEKSGTKPTLPR